MITDPRVETCCCGGRTRGGVRAGWRPVECDFFVVSGSTGPGEGGGGSLGKGYLIAHGRSSCSSSSAFSLSISLFLSFS